MICYVYRDARLNTYTFQDENDIFNLCQDPYILGLEYLFHFAYHLDKLLPEQGYKYVITGSLNELPEYGKHIVVITMWDEWCRPPMYAHKVGFVLSTYGFQFDNYFSKPILSQYNFIKLFKTVWIQYNRLPYLFNHALKTGFSKADKNLFPIPLGYYKHEKVPFKSIGERPIDVHFAGSIYATGEKYKNPIAKYFKGLMTSPRNYARQKLVEVLSKMEEKYPQFSITNRCFNGFAKGLNRYEYSLEMMDTKICLAPRGSSLETYRLFEAMRSGCVVIADKQPQKWYYDTVPALFVDDWSEMEGVVNDLLNDTERLDSLSQQSLNWWQNVASPMAAAQYIKQQMGYKKEEKATELAYA